MRHLYFFYFFITIIFGSIVLSIAVVLYAKTKERLIRQYLGFYAAFTLVVFCNTSASYISANLPAINPTLLGVLAYIGEISMYVLMFTIPVLMHALCDVPRASFRNAVVGGIALLTFFGFNVFEYVISVPGIKRIGPYIGETIFLAVILYTVLIGFRHLRRLPDGDRKQAARKYLLLHALFFPGIFSDMAISRDVIPLEFFPILYCCMGAVFTHHFLTRYFHPMPAAEHMTPSEDIFAKHNISPREQEIVNLVLQGCSNQKIAEALFISLHTVKSHLRNIYQKFEVSSRYELIALFQNPSVNTRTEHHSE